MKLFSNSKHKAVAGWGCRVLFLSIIGIFSSFALAQNMEVNPIDPNDCVIYTAVQGTTTVNLAQVGPLKNFGVRPPVEVWDFPIKYQANICSEGDIIPKAGNFKAPTPLVNAAVALAAAGIIELQQGNAAFETHTKDAASLILGAGVTNPLPANQWFDITAASFTGTGIAFPNDIIPGATEFRCVSDKVDIFPDGVATPGFGTGPWGDLILNKCVLNFVPDPNGVAPPIYTFSTFKSRNSAVKFTAFENPDILNVANILQIRVKRWMRLGHTDAFNQENVHYITVWVEGADGQDGFDPPNPNGPGAASIEAMAMTFGGDGALNACHFYVPNGTIGISGAVASHARFLAGNFQQNGGGGAVNVIHPQHICGAPIVAQCLLIKSLSCQGGGPLVIEGEGFDVGNVTFLTVYDQASTAALGGLFTDPTSVAAGIASAIDLTLGGTTLTADLSVFGLADGTVTTFVGVVGPNVGSPPTTSGFYMYTNQRLELTTVGGVTTCQVLTP